MTVALSIYPNLARARDAWLMAMEREVPLGATSRRVDMTVTLLGGVVLKFDYAARASDCVKFAGLAYDTLILDPACPYEVEVEMRKWPARSST